MRAILVMFGCGLCACSDREIRSNPTSVSGYDNDRVIVAEGRWITVGSAHSMISRVNSVEILCDIAARTCFEARADLQTPADDGADFDALFTQVQHYQVVAFANRVLTARAVTPAYHLELRIDLNSRAAQRFARELPPAGASTARPRAYEWALR